MSPIIAEKPSAKQGGRARDLSRWPVLCGDTHTRTSHEKRPFPPPVAAAREAPFRGAAGRLVDRGGCRGIVRSLKGAPMRLQRRTSGLALVALGACALGLGCGTSGTEATGTGGGPAAGLGRRDGRGGHDRWRGHPGARHDGRRRRAGTGGGTAGRGATRAPQPSAGCGKPAGLTSGRASIDVAGKTREYILAVPSNYDRTSLTGWSSAGTRGAGRRSRRSKWATSGFRARAAARRSWSRPRVRSTRTTGSAGGTRTARTSPSPAR